MKMLCQELLEVNYANLEDVHTSLMYSLVVLIILKMLCQELLEGSKQCQSRRRSH